MNYLTGRGCIQLAVRSTPAAQFVDAPAKMQAAVAELGHTGALPESEGNQSHIPPLGHVAASVRASVACWLDRYLVAKLSKFSKGVTCCTCAEKPGKSTSP